MPVACSTSALTGQEGSIYFQPAGTHFCLLDHTDFPAGSDITVPSNHDYKVGDPVVFTEEGTGNLDSALTAGTTYFVVARTDTTIQVSATAGGTAITLNGDGGVSGVITALDDAGLTAGAGYTDGEYADVPLTGGSGTGATATVFVAGGVVAAVVLASGGTGYQAGDSLSADDDDLGGGGGAGFSIDVDVIAPAVDTAGAANHIGLAYAEFAAICAVREFSVSIERESLDVTTLPCGVGAGGGKYAAFRKTQAGYASGTGSMTVYFSDNQLSLANRLMGNVLLKSQEGARVRLFVNTVSDGAATPAPDLHDSLYLEADISITQMSLSVNPDDATTGELEFSILNPTHILGEDLT